ncbi:D-alanyl-D-alanine carboxypeptidase [Daejeonella sp.]|uniref:D-alanyl-D-alanine carboxypeptidase/D-alanyl-D-alanine-endopeptidase n=1 Tax=Daejeonella sp. TaxID=2805397 RepID=UPI0025C5BD5B|nr:D-alanyl-D-alanine carboxypeptidase [Daejeonella sp.]
MKIKMLIWALITLLSIEYLAAKNIPPRKILKMFKNSEVLKQQFTGFALYDLEKRKMLVELNSDKYFTPASNTKLFTFYAGLKLLKDSIAGLHYVERGDSLIFWGTADPSFLNRELREQRVLKNLSSSKKKLYWSNGLYNGDFYGMGWSYDDYNDYYQPEISELPIYGNVVFFSKKNNALSTYPEIVNGGQITLQTEKTSSSTRFRIRRNLFNNEFHIPNSAIPSNFNQTVPFKVSDQVVSELLKQSFPNFSGITSQKKPLDAKTWYSVPSDTLFRAMLLPSDNFIAEHILLNIAATKGMEMNTSLVIDHVTKNYLSDLPDKALWVDGSGLSRQNLFTPRTMVKLCEKIYDEVSDEERLFDLLPQGGKTGTLKNIYKSDKPYVFAKTGSLSNNHNQSGYLISRKGKKYIFSFMNNNFTEPTAVIRAEMEKIINTINQNY